MFPAPRSELPGIGEPALHHAAYGNELRLAMPEEIEFVDIDGGETVPYAITGNWADLRRIPRADTPEVCLLGMS